MSIPVAPDELAEAMSGFDGGYLLTTSAQGRVKVVAVDPEVSGNTLVLTGPGKGSAGNVAANPLVTVVFWPQQHHGYSLIVDGEARGDQDRIEVTATGVVLHRPASHADGPMAASDDGCGNDCQRLA